MKRLFTAAVLFVFALFHLQNTITVNVFFGNTVPCKAFISDYYIHFRVFGCNQIHQKRRIGIKHNVAVVFRIFFYKKVDS